MKKAQRKEARPAGAKKTKPNAHPKAGESHFEQKPSVPKPAASRTGRVRPTLEAMVQSFTPKERKDFEFYRRIRGPDVLTEQLTPEQKAERDQFRAEKWLEYKARSIQYGRSYAARRAAAIKAIHSFADESLWFAENTPHPFKLYSTPIVEFARLSCRYLQDLARWGNEDAIQELARLAMDLTETLDELLSHPNAGTVEHIAEIIRGIAAKVPYWPVLYHRHAAPKKHFRVVADLLHLGAKCPVNASKGAKYQLQTSINRLVWNTLRPFQDAHLILAWAEKHKKTAEEALSWTTLRKETPLFKRSYRLKPLTKSTAEKWADTAIMPMLRVRYPDFYAEPVLKTILEKRNPKSREAEFTAIRKAVIQSLRSLAVNSLDKTRPS